MSPTVPASRRPGYTLVIVLAVSFLVLAFAAIMGGLVMLEWDRDRQMMLDAHACQLVAGAQAWSHQHAAELAAQQPVVLPVDHVLPAGMTGTAEVRRVEPTPGSVHVECEVRVERAGRSLTRRATWPLARPAQ